MVKMNSGILNILFLLQFLLFKSVYAEEEVSLELPDGKIKGIIQATRANTTFYSFLSLRYAQPPVGELRFQAPKKVEPWDDVYDATYEKNLCYQVTTNSDSESEDCLYLNVFTPVNPLSNSTLLPVMFFIHGGGFIEGSGQVQMGFGPKFFMDYDIVLVSINYRLGPFGFLSTGDTVIPGNIGLKDQNMAMRWVQENIKYFGGDPDKVTIFGHSAGSASVSYHILSERSKGLFRAAICESGSALSAWAYQRDQKNITFRTGAAINPDFQDSDNSSALLDYLMKVDALQIDAASTQINNSETNYNLQIQQGFYYAPVIEVEHEDAFLTKRMYESFENGDFNKVPTLIGMVAEESIFMLSDYFHYILEAIDKDISILVPHDLHSNITNLGYIIKLLYGEGPFVENVAGAIRYFSDQSFTKSLIKQAELQSVYADVYFYEFTYDGIMGDCDKSLAGTGNVTHGEETNYMWSRLLWSTNKWDNTDLSKFPEDDVNVHYRVMKIWTNFAKYLNPTPDADDEVLQNLTWPKLDGTQVKNNLTYVDIGKDLVLKSNPKHETYPYWDIIYDNYGVKPYDTF